MDKTLSGKVAFVTGSGRGLGRAIATRLAELGADVGIHDVNEEGPAKFGEAPSLTAVRDCFAQYGVRCASVTGEISSEEAVARMAQTIQAELGPVDILVNCAGGDIGAKGNKPNPNGALDIAPDDMRALLNSNFVGTLLICRNFVPPMVERKQGCVINIASVAAHFGTSPEVVYSSIKAAIVHFTRCLAFEMRPHNVRVNAISPGPTRTARFVSTRRVDPAMMAESGLMRYGTPGDIANAVAFLASDAAQFIHGQILRVDGGMSLYAG